MSNETYLLTLRKSFVPRLNQIEPKLFYLKERYLNGTSIEEKQFAAKVIRSGSGGACAR